jgi:alpha-galactosidase
LEPGRNLSGRHHLSSPPQGGVADDGLPSRPAGSGRLRISADGPVSISEAPGPLGDVLGVRADRVAAGAGVPPPRRLGSVWCSWYCYWRKVTGDDVLRNEDDARRLAIPVEVVQIDDGWQAAIGDWDEVAPRFGDLSATVGTRRERGQEVGIWLAPLIAVPSSRLASEHPEWLVDGANSGFNWDEPLRAVDVTHPRRGRAPAPLCPPPGRHRSHLLQA